MNRILTCSTDPYNKEKENPTLSNGINSFGLNEYFSLRREPFTLNWSKGVLLSHSCFDTLSKNGLNGKHLDFNMKTLYILSVWVGYGWWESEDI